MKKSIFIVAIILIAALCAAAFVGCTTDPYDYHIEGAPTLKVATNAEFPPFEYMENDKIIGFDIALIKLICKRMGYNVEVESMEFDAALLAVQAGTHDIAIAGITKNDERDEMMDFSDDYFSAAQVVVVKSDNTEYDNIKNADELAEALIGKKINVAFGQIAQFYAEGDENFSYPGIKDATVVRQSSVNTAILATDKTSVTICDDTVAQTIVANTNGQYKVVSYNNETIKLTDEKYAIGVKNGNTELISKINEALKAFSEDGTIEKLKEEFIYLK